MATRTETPHTEPAAPPADEAMVASGAGGGEGRAYAAEKKADDSGVMVSRSMPRPDAKPAVTTAAPEEPRQRGGLQGGSKDDVGQRRDYLKYLAEFGRGDVHTVDVQQRVMVNVKDDLEQGLPNAQVVISTQGRPVFKGTSYANGRTQFFPRDAGLRGNETLDVSVTSQGRAEKRTITLSGVDQDISVVVAAMAQRKAPIVDVMFVLDTTGSMGDEIARIQLTLLEVAARIQRLEPNATVRYGLTLYRDRGDSYVTQVKDFTTDTRAFLAELQQVDADGGGDIPEALNEGLHAAIHGARWTPAEVPNAVRVAILVADAPPHLDYEQDYDYAKEMKAASDKGIKIFPVAASGLEDQGEFIFRQMAHHTMGRFVFITYGGGTSHHVGQFANNNLDDLVVGLVADEMADLMGKSRNTFRAVAMAR